MTFGLDRFTEFCRKQQLEEMGQEMPKPRYDEPQAPTERWTVYSFTLPTRYSNKVALGFESKAAAQAFIEQHLIKREVRTDPEGNEYLMAQERAVEIGGERYSVHYDVIRDSRGAVDVYYNDRPVSTAGDNKEEVFRQWVR